MIHNQRVFAYIDAANLHKGVEALGWELDYRRFRVWLSEKYGIKKAFLFIGFIPKYQEMYHFLENAGFTLIFKDTVFDDKGKPKGNCDADLVLKMIVDFYENRYDKAILVSGDGDYSSLVDFLNRKKAFRIIISPVNKCSILLRRLNTPILYLDTQRGILQKRV